MRFALTPFDTLRHCSHLARETGTVGPDDLAALGLTRGALRDVALMPAEQVARMRSMGALHGVDMRHDLDPRDQAELSLRCARCADNGRCRRDLAAGVSDTARLDYCPNASLYAAVAGG